MQPQSANQNECWNWFEGHDQVRGSGEPQIITAMVTAGAYYFLREVECVKKMNRQYARGNEAGRDREN